MKSFLFFCMWLIAGFCFGVILKLFLEDLKTMKELKLIAKRHKRERRELLKAVIIESLVFIASQKKSK